jgi:putative transcriptional regulator
MNTRPFQSLAGKILIAMPSIGGEPFHSAVVYLCAHSEQGAMGLIVNKPADLMYFADLLERVELSQPADSLPDDILRMPVRLGGPVDQFRGFILHSDDYSSEESTLKVGNSLALTATLDILAAIAEGRGPARRIAALGYSGWAPGQLEDEMQHNSWLHCEVDTDLIFSENLDVKHDRALKSLGVDPRRLSGDVGHA